MIELDQVEEFTSTDCSDGDSNDVASLEQTKLARVFLLVRGGKCEQALEILEESPSLWHKPEAEGYTLLHWGSLFGHVQFVSQGLAKGATVDAVASNGQTPFMWSVIRGHIPAARLLLDAKASLRLKDSVGATPLTLAVQHERHTTILLLMAISSPEELLADVDEKGCTPLHWAAYKGDATSIRLLEYFNVDFSVVDKSGMTPLHRAVQAGQNKVWEVLLDKGVNPHHRDLEGKTCLDLAAETNPNSQRTLRRLLKNKGMTSPALVKDQDLESGSSSRQWKNNHDHINEELAAFRGKVAHNLPATCWLVCVSLAVFEYLVEMRTLCWTTRPNIAMCFELGVIASLCLFFFVANVDPGKVPPRVRTTSAVEEFMNGLRAYTPGDSNAVLPDMNRLCTSTWIIKGLRTKYCTKTGACVDEFDHFCGWLNVAIGRGNHRPFVVLAVVEPLTQLCHFVLCFACAGNFVSRDTFWEWIKGLALEFPLLVVVILVHGLTMPGVVCLCLHQLRLVAVNMTTNEMMNAYRYPHFWVEKTTPGRANGAKVFRNPFSKGNLIKNCLDFWWWRSRSATWPAPEKGTRCKECDNCG